MGKKAEIRIQNRSSFALELSITETTRVKNDGLASIQGTIPRNGCLPQEGYSTIEGEPRLRVHKDGKLNLLARRKDEEGGWTASVQLYVDHGKWWSRCDTPTDIYGHEGVVLSTDVIDGERIEIRIFDAIPTATWMSYTADTIQDTPLCRVVMPGTHDSATYAFRKDLGASSDSDLTQKIQDRLEVGKGVIRKIGSKISDGVLKIVFERMCKCQELTIQQQLEAGIRYLDLRITEGKGEFYTCHGVYCVHMGEVLDEVTAFLAKHPKEIVLLDFNHFYSMTDELHEQFSKLVLEKLGDTVAKHTDLQPSSPVREFWAKGVQAVVIYHHDATQQASGGKLWDRRLIRSPWPNTQKTDELKTKLEESMATRSLNHFFVLQGILTPDTDLIREEIVENRGNMSIRTIASRVSNNVADWVAEEWKDHQHNVVFVDFFNDSFVVPAIVSLNKKTPPGANPTATKQNQGNKKAGNQKK